MTFLLSPKTIGKIILNIALQTHKLGLVIGRNLLLSPSWGDHLPLPACVTHGAAHIL